MKKIALVTGAARRIGAAIATFLHQQGYDVVIHYKNSETEAHQLINKLNELRADSAIAIRAELCDKDDRRNLLNAIEKKYGALHLLVNNASIFTKTPIDRTDEAEFDKIMQANAKAPYFLSLDARKLLKSCEGVIINIGDIHAAKPLRDYSLYTASKAALNMMTKSLAKEFAPQIRVNGVNPGAIMWPEDKSEVTDAIKQKIINATPLKRSGTPQDIAKAVYYLSEMDFVTGQILSVDGGRILSHS